MRIDKVYAGTYAYSSHTTVRRRCTEGLSVNTYSCCSTSRKISDEKTPYEKSPLDTSESLYRRKCNGGKSTSGGKSGSKQNRDPRIPNAGDPGGQRPDENGGRRHLRD